MAHRLPNKGESKAAYIDSCMVDPDLKQMYPFGDQRVAFLEEQYDALSDVQEQPPAQQVPDDFKPKPVTLDTVKKKKKKVRKKK